jgi:hypothetical protein
MCSPLPWSLYDSRIGAVIPSGARNLALSIFNAVRDSSSPAAPRNDTQTGLSHGLPNGEGYISLFSTPAVQPNMWDAPSPKGECYGFDFHPLQFSVRLWPGGIPRHAH